jgi:hypothetical protein
LLPEQGIVTKDQGLAVVLEADADDLDASELNQKSLKIQFEVKPAGTDELGNPVDPFDGTVTVESEVFIHTQGGNPTIRYVEVPNLLENQTYKWRARVINTDTSVPSTWVDFGTGAGQTGNQEVDADFLTADAPAVTATPTASPSATLAPTATPTAGPTATPTLTPTITPIPSATPTPTATPIPTATIVPTTTSVPTPTVTATPIPTATPILSPTGPTAPPLPLTNTPVPTATNVAPSATSIPGPTHTPAPTNTDAPTATPQPPTHTPTPTKPAPLVNTGIPVSIALVGGVYFILSLGAIHLLFRQN